MENLYVPCTDKNIKMVTATVNGDIQIHLVKKTDKVMINEAALRHMITELERANGRRL